MAKLNKLKVVLAERDLNNKWLAEIIGKDFVTYQYDSVEF